MDNNKIDANDVSTLEELQPNERIIAEVENTSELSEYEYEYLKNELNAYYNKPLKSLYSLPRDSTSIEWDHPHVTRPKDELYAQLRFYDIIKSKEKLTINQLKQIEKEVRQIYAELLEIDGYEYFLKHGHEKLRLDKLNRWEDPKNIKFYQRENDIIYDNTINEYVSISLPIEKWWISEDDLKKHNYDDQAHREFVNINAKIKESSYDVDNYVLNNKDDENIAVEQEKEFGIGIPELPEKENRVKVETFSSRWRKKFKKSKDKVIESKKEEKNDNETAKPESPKTTIPPIPPTPSGSFPGVVKHPTAPVAKPLPGMASKPPISPTPFPGIANKPQVPPKVNTNSTVQRPPLPPGSQPPPVNTTKQFFDYQNK